LIIGVGYWSGLLEWATYLITEGQVSHWSGLLEWATGVGYRLEWATGVGYRLEWAISYNNKAVTINLIIKLWRILNLSNLKLALIL
jgi:hypothetical protein